jgi:hypothetical protein
MIGIMPEEVRQEVAVWTDLLKVLCDGMPRPNDISFYVKRLKDLERDGYDVRALKECCMEEATIREVKDFKPYIFAILERLEKLTDLKLKYR